MLVFINYFSILGKPLYVVFFLQLIFKKLFLCYTSTFSQNGVTMITFTPMLKKKNKRKKIDQIYETWF